MSEQRVMPVEGLALPSDDLPSPLEQGSNPDWWKDSQIRRYTLSINVANLNLPLARELREVVEQWVMENEGWVRNVGVGETQSMHF